MSKLTDSLIRHLFPSFEMAGTSYKSSALRREASPRLGRNNFLGQKNAQELGSRSATPRFLGIYRYSAGNDLYVSSLKHIPHSIAYERSNYNYSMGCSRLKIFMHEEDTRA